MNEVSTIIQSPDEFKTEVHNKVINALISKFPIETDKYKVEISNISIKLKELTHNMEKYILLNKGNVSDGVFCDLTIINKQTNKPILTLKNHKILNIPKITNRYTFIVDGNEYAIVNQMRTKPGVYTRFKNNMLLESSFNLAKGANFKLYLDAVSGVFKIDILHHTIPLTALLYILGADDTIIQQFLGKELAQANKISDNTYNTSINKLYELLVVYKENKQKLENLKEVVENEDDEEANKEVIVVSHTGGQASKEEKIKKIREYFNNTEIDPKTTEITLKKGFDKINYEILLRAAQKLLAVYNNKEEPDNRDSLYFQKIYTASDIIAEVIQKNTNLEIAKIKNKLNSFTPSGNKTEDEKTLRNILNPAVFTKPLKNFITTSTISRLPTQINPVEILDTKMIVTRMGEGAIEDERAVPDDARSIDESYIGVIDLMATPESTKVGIDNRLSLGALKGEDNEFYIKVINKKTDQIEYKSLIDLYNKKVKIPKAEESGKVFVKYQGKIIKVIPNEVDYEIPYSSQLFTITTGSIPMVNANQGNRIIMGAKHVQQAMPLKNRENRLVRNIHDSIVTQSKDSKSLNFTNVEQYLSHVIDRRSPVDGVVTKIDDHYIYIKSNNGEVKKVEYVKDLPLASKTMLNHTLLVKVGDKVKNGQLLTESDYTKNGESALGINLNVAYMPYKGLNHEDGIVISESAAKKLTSFHTDKIIVDLDKTSILDKDKFTRYFPVKFDLEQLKNLDEDGVIKKGSIVKKGDPLILLMQDNSQSKLNTVLGKLHKSLIHPYIDLSTIYEEEEEGVVQEVFKTRNRIGIIIKREAPAKLGDKLTGSYGNKGVITKIVPDDLMPKNEDGEPIDVILTPIGVVGRINPAQILETALGKIAKKTGKVYEIPLFSDKNLVEFVENELRKHNLKDKETIYDPETGKKIPNIFTGVQYMYKVFKTTDTNFAARGIEGPHDMDDAPTGSGEIGPKAIGGMEVNALIAHNARNLMKESTLIRGSKNTEFWNNFQYGIVAHYPTEKKTFNKFVNILKQAGISVKKEGDYISAGPLTDKEIEEMSNGEVSKALMISSKDLSPEKEGLFDESIFGGMNGTKWGHINLAEPVINPVFEDSVAKLLQLTKTQLRQLYYEKGGEHIKELLKKVDIDKLEKDIENKIDNLKGVELDNAIKTIKYIRALKKLNLKPDEAYMLTKFPVTPPYIRPIVPGKSGDLLTNDANLFYRNLILTNNSFKEIKPYGLPEELKKAREGLYTTLQETTGIIAPKTKELQNKNAKGALHYIAGDQPKYGYFQRKVIYSKMNLSGRATVAPDNEIGLDQIGLPEDMAWSMYKPFIIRELVKQGYGAVQANEMVEKREEKAKQILLEEMKKRPVLYNRAPTLWRYNIMAAEPILLPNTKTIKYNSLIEKGLNVDNDGDAFNVHLPVTDEAIEEAKKMFPSKLIYSDKSRKNMIIFPNQEPIMGLYKATQNIGQPCQEKNVRVFNTLKEAWDAYYRNEIKMTTCVIIKSLRN